MSRDIKAAMALLALCGIIFAVFMGAKLWAYDWDIRCAIADCRVVKDDCAKTHEVKVGHD